MRWPTVLAVVVVAGVADAKPRSPDLLEPYSNRDTCESGKSWPKLRTCLQRGKATVATLYDLDTAKLVTVHASGDTSSVFLFLLRDGVWHKANIYSTVGPGNEVLSFKRLAKTHGYRLELGNTMATSASVGESTRPVTLRRIVTTICLDETGYCRTLITRCEGLIDGKTYWAYRGELVTYRNNNLRLVGDTSRAGTMCAPPKSFVTTEPEGDPLE